MLTGRLFGDPIKDLSAGSRTRCMSMPMTLLGDEDSPQESVNKCVIGDVFFCINQSRGSINQWTYITKPSVSSHVPLFRRFGQSEKLILDHSHSLCLHRLHIGGVLMMITFYNLDFYGGTILLFVRGLCELSPHVTRSWQLDLS